MVHGHPESDSSWRKLKEMNKKGFPSADYYDDFDYQGYWQKRHYEDLSGRTALNNLLDQINCKSKKELIDVGCGFGRLAEIYGNKFQHSALVDPSSKNLKKAEHNLGRKKFSYFKSYGSQLPFDDNRFDTALMIRVIHHLHQPETVVKEIRRILKPKGHFILEFANKCHSKACLMNPCRLNSLEPVDISVSDSSLPFKNYHPKWINNLLADNGFSVLKRLSVSNFRNPFIKKIVPDSLLLFVGKRLQKPLAKLNFGPSIFILAVKEPA